MDVEQALSALDRQLPPGAVASWFAADPSSATGAPGSRSPSGPVARLLAGLADLLTEVGGDFADGGTQLLVETRGQTVLVHRVSDAGALVVEAGKGLNLALVRRLVVLTLEELGEDLPAGEPVVTPLPSRRDAGGPPAFPRRTPPAPVTDFQFVPEDAEVLRMLEQALTV